MQLAAFESAALRSASPVPPAQANEALRAATERLGGKGKIALQGDRAVLTFSGVPFEALAQLARRSAQRGARAAGRSAAPQGRFRLQRLDLDHPGGQPMIRKKRDRQLWSPTVASTGWSESTLAEQAWVQARGAAVRWAVAGGIVGVHRRPGAVRAGVVAGERDRLVDRRPARPRRCARNRLVGQRRRRPRRRPGQPRRELASRPARVDAVAALVRRRARGAPRVLPQRHDADPDPARPRPHPRHARCRAPTGSASGRAPGSAASARPGTRSSSAAASAFSRPA